MGRLRTLAALLAIISAGSAFLAARMGSAGGAALLIVGAAALALAVPFPAPNPPQRRRFTWVCAVFVLLALSSAVVALRSPETESFGLLILAQAAAGALIFVQAYRTRNRRRAPDGFKAYFIS